MELQRIIRDISQFGDTITISAVKDCIQFRSGEAYDCQRLESFSLIWLQCDRKHWLWQHQAVPECNRGTQKYFPLFLTNSLQADDRSVTIDILDPVTLQFAGKYLNMFLRAASLSSRVTLSMSSDVPLMVTFNIGEIGDLKYYLAPKIEDEWMLVTI